MGITEKAAYLKGLAEGLNLDTEKSEGKLISKMLELISEMSERIEVLEGDNEQLFTYMEGMAEDLVNMENDFYGIEEDAEDYSDLNDEDDYDEYTDEEYYEVECPTCGEKICFTEDIDLDNFACPACGNKIDDIELIDDCEDCSGCDADCECAGQCDGCAK